MSLHWWLSHITRDIPDLQHAVIVRYQALVSRGGQSETELLFRTVLYMHNYAMRRLLPPNKRLKRGLVIIT